MKNLIGKVLFTILLIFNAAYCDNLILAHQSYFPTTASNMEIIGNEVYLMRSDGLDIYNLLSKNITNNFPSYGEEFNTITTDGHYIYMLINNDQIVVIDALNKSAYSLMYEYDYYPPLSSFTENGVTPNLYDIKYVSNKLLLYLAYPHHSKIVALDATDPLHIHYTPKYHKDFFGNIVNNGDNYCYYIKNNGGIADVGVYSLSSQTDVGNYHVGGNADYAYITRLAENSKYLFVGFGFRDYTNNIFANAFDIVDKSDPSNPVWKKYIQQPLTVIAATDKYLFGEKDGALSIWDISSYKNSKEVYTIKNYNFGAIYKIIPKGDKLYVLSSRGFDIFKVYEYNPNLLNQFHTINIKPLF